MLRALLFGRRRPQRSDLRFVVYTRDACHLCETAWQVLCEYQRQHGFALEAADVDGSPELVSKYGNCVPVVTVNGAVRFRGAVNPVLLQRLLDAPPGA
jgi:hypothetical protein